MTEMSGSKIERMSREPAWVALASLLALGLSAILGLYVSGITGIVIALLPLILLILILAIYNPYPFWLVYFLLTPFSYIVGDFIPMESFVRFGGLVLVVLSIPSILMSKKTETFKITPVGASILMFLVGCVLSLLAMFDLENTFAGIFLFLGNFVAYWVFVNILGEQKRVNTIINVLIVSLTIESIIAIVQKVLNNPLVRATGTMSDPNYFGFWLLPFLCFAFYFGVSSTSKWKKFLYFGAYFLMTVTVPLTFSRSMLLVLIPTQFVLFWRQRKLLLFFVMSIVLVGLLYLSFFEIFSKGMNLETFLRGARAASVDWRGYFAVTALRIFFDHPLFGVGADCFRWIFGYYSQTSARNVVPVIHDAYLEILSGTGLFGFIPFAVILFFALRNFLRARKYYFKQGDRQKTLQMEGLFVGFGSSLLAHFFLSTQHHITLWLFIAFSTIVANSSFDKGDLEGVTPRKPGTAKTSLAAAGRKEKPPKDQLSSGRIKRKLPG